MRRVRSKLWIVPSPFCPLRPGIPKRQTHDYPRHGATTLFAALNVLSGEVLGNCMPRHRHQEFLRFLQRIERNTPCRMTVHLILDNHGTHPHPAVETGFRSHPRYHRHFMSTGASWLNRVEGFFAEITDKRIREELPALVSWYRLSATTVVATITPNRWCGPPRLAHCTEC
jgi:transposase